MNQITAQNNSNENKTHYRKAFNSPYLSSADIIGNTILTVEKTILESDKSKRTKDSFNTVYFQEKHIRQGEVLKPMILNAINSKTMYELTGSHYIEDWEGTRITVYVDPNVRFGRDTVEGLRISTQPPVLLVYADSDFNKNFPNWEKIIKSGKKSYVQFIPVLIQRCNFSNEQLEKLNQLKKIEVEQNA